MERDDKVARQEELLEEIREMLYAHKEFHKITDPAVLELVDILKGMKLIRQLAIGLAGFVGAGYVFFSTIWDHFKDFK